MDTEPSEDPRRLLRQVAGGDRDAFGRFYDRYAPLVFTFAVRLLRVRAEAEDLLQEVFLQAWHQADRYREERGSPEAWLVTITRSRGIDKLRSTRRRDEKILPAEESAGRQVGGMVESGAAQSDAKLAVTGALGGLPEAQRRVLELAYFDGLTQSEIAARLGEPLGTVKTRMRGGLERLRGIFGTTGATGLP